MLSPVTRSPCRSSLILPALGLLVLSAARLPAQHTLERKKIKIEIEWATTSSKNYAIEYEKVIPSNAVDTVKKELEEILEQYVKLFRHKPEDKLRIRFLDSGNTWRQIGGDDSHPGFYNPGDQILYILQRPFYDLIPTVYHEAFHQYLSDYVGPETPIPTWFNEGMAMYYESMQRDTHTRAKKLNPDKIDSRKIRMVQDALRTRTHIPIPELVDATHEDFHKKDRESLFYHSSFSLAYCLMELTHGKAAYDFATELKKTKDIEAANTKLFGRERKNLPKIETYWTQFTLKLATDRAPR